jgi:hypothetical protein
MHNIDEFLSDIRDVHPDVLDYTDGFTVAMETVDRFDREGESLFFGQIGTGTFFSSNDFEMCRWYSDTNEFGDEVAEPLSSW